MEERDLLIKALRNAIIKMKVYELQSFNMVDEELLRLLDRNVLNMRNVDGKEELDKIVHIMDDVGFDVFQSLDVDDVANLFGLESTSLYKEMSDSVEEEEDGLVDFLNEDIFFSHLMFHTVYEMITEGDYPDRIPKELIDKTLEFFREEEDFATCIAIKRFADNNKRLIVSNMSSQEFEQWQRKNIWKFHA